jgi:hypothetical protein
MTTATITHKTDSIYFAYSPSFDVSTYGACQDEALNNLTDELRGRAQQETGEERNSDAFG